MIITEDNIKRADPKILLTPEAFLQCKDIVFGAIADGTVDYARELLFIFTEKLSAVGDNMDPNLFANYLLLIKALKFLTLKGLSDSEKEKMFKEEIVDLFIADFFEVKEEVERLLRSYWAVPDTMDDLRQILVKGLEKNTEIIGEGKIKVTVSGEEKMIEPTLQNWLFDYNSTVHKSPEMSKRGGYEQVSFVTSSGNAKVLSKEERNLLLNIIQFYDWLKYEKLSYNFRLPEQGPYEDEFVEIKTPQKYIPDDLIESINKLRESRAAKQAKNAKSQAPSYIKQEKFVLPKQELGNLPKQPLNKQSFPKHLQEDGVEKENILSPGLKFGAGGSTDIKKLLQKKQPPIPPSPQQARIVDDESRIKNEKQRQIDQKLEELKKKKVGGKNYE
jgi:hypothetical protein